MKIESKYSSPTAHAYKSLLEKDVAEACRKGLAATVASTYGGSVDPAGGGGGGGGGGAKPFDVATSNPFDSFCSSIAVAAKPPAVASRASSGPAPIVAAAPP